jgi:cytochrome d ubiquinol oxidase subunit II
MGTIWFWLVAFMLTAYVALDGFDIGVGILHLFITRSDDERRLTLRTIGPVWDGNEVWLIAGGGTLYFAFPPVYASSFSGFYLPLMIVLWLLILRGISIELRSHLSLWVWRAFFDALFSFSSALLAIFFGAALANVIRGVPLSADGTFFLPLWTNWRVSPTPGILDWYTVIGGVLSLIALAAHGSLYLAVKTSGDLQTRARAILRLLWAPLAVLTIISLIATMNIRPHTLGNYTAHPIAFIIPLGVLLSLLGIIFFSFTQRDQRAFASSTVYLSLMMIGAAYGLYPALLPSITDPALDLTIHNARSGSYALHVGLIWWGFGMLLAFTYFGIVYWMFRGKVDLNSEGYGH